MKVAGAGKVFQVFPALRSALTTRGLVGHNPRIAVVFGCASTRVLPANPTTLARLSLQPSCMSPHVFAFLADHPAAASMRAARNNNRARRGMTRFRSIRKDGKAFASIC